MGDDTYLINDKFVNLNILGNINASTINLNNLILKSEFNINSNLSVNKCNINNINVSNNSVLGNIKIYDNIISTLNEDSNIIIYSKTLDKIGIGTTNPQEKIHISGNILLDDNLIVNGLSTFNNSIINGVPNINNDIIVNSIGTFNNLDILNNLIVRGETTIFNTDQVLVKDNIIHINNDSSITDSNIYRDAGILINRGNTGSDVFMGWDESDENFIFGTVTSTNLDSQGNENLLLTPDNLRVNILKSNKVGIGTNEPQSNLEVYGNSLFHSNVNVKGSLNVDSDVTFNSITQSTDSLTGTLVVKGGAGISKNINIGGSLNIDSATTINSILESTDSSTGALVISGGGGIAKNVNIGGYLNVQNSTNLLNTLTVDSDVTFNSTTQSLDSSTGALIVNGGVGIRKNINIGGSLNVDSSTTINSSVQSINSSSGSLIVSGGIGIAKNINIGGSLNVQNSTNLSNTLTVDSDVIFNSITQSTDLSTGTLIVNGGAAITKNINIGGSLNIDSDTTLNSSIQSTDSSTGTLVINGGIGIDKNVNIGGLLNVDSDAIFNSTTQSTDSLTGALIISGGSGIAKNVNIGGSLNVDSDVTFNSTTQSTDSSSGALIVKGGVGINKNINIGGFLNINSATSINSTTQSTDSSTGALVINGGVGIGNNVNIGGNLNIDGLTTISNVLQVDSDFNINGNTNINGNIYINNILFDNFKNKYEIDLRNALTQQHITYIIDSNNSISDAKDIFVPVSFKTQTTLDYTIPIDFIIKGNPSYLDGSDSYNETTLMGTVRGGGWSENHYFVETQSIMYEQNERRFSRIYEGLKNVSNYIVIFFRYGYNYNVITNSINVEPHILGTKLSGTNSSNGDDITQWDSSYDSIITLEDSAGTVLAVPTDSAYENQRLNMTEIHNLLDGFNGDDPDRRLNYKKTDGYLNLSKGLGVSTTPISNSSGDVNITGDYYKNNNKILNFYLDIANSNEIIYNNSDNIGIGINEPSYKLEVNGNVNVNGNLILYNNSNIFRVQFSYLEDFDVSPGDSFTGSRYLSFSSFPEMFNRQFIYSNRDSDTTHSINNLNLINSLGIEFGYSNYFTKYPTEYSYNPQGHSFRFHTSTTDSSLNEKMCIDYQGYVGIGTANPVNNLDILNNSSNSTISIKSYSNNAKKQIIFYNNNNGNTGFEIGLDSNNYGFITTQGNKLDIYNPNTINFKAYRNPATSVGDSGIYTPLTIKGSDSDLVIINGHNLNDDYNSLSLRNGNDSNSFHSGAQIAFGYNGTNTYQHFIHTRHNNSNSNNAIDFYVCDGTINNNVNSGSVHTMSIVSGNVGIGTTTPEQKLDVRNGNIRLTADSGTGTSGKYIEWVANGESSNCMYIGDKDSDTSMHIGTRNVSGTSRSIKLTPDENNTMELFNNKIVCNEKVGIGTNDPQGMIQINGDIYYGNTHKTLPLYVKGTGLNNSTNCKIILGGDTIIDHDLRGLTLIIIDGTNLTVKNFDIVGYISKNILDYRNDWLEVLSGSSITSSNRPINWLPYQNVDSENKIFHNEVGPFGNSESIWKTESLDSDNAGWDGGWNTDTFNVDTSYGYLYTVYFKPTVYSKSANSSNEQSVLNFFFGCRQVRHLDSDNVSDNPYFISSVQMKNAGLLENRWYLAVGTILPSSTPTNATQTMPNSLTGIYDTVTRTKINISSSLLYDWRHVDVNNINTHRAGVIYGGTNIGEKVEFARPGVYKIDGTEPSLQDLLGSRYDIYDSRKASNDLGNKLKEIKKTDIGILVSYDAIGTTKSGGQTTTNLREAFLRVGLVKLSNLRDINFINRQSYAAVFYGTDADNDNSNINSKGYNRDVIERIESEDAWNNNYNAPSASINTILSTDGTYGGIMGAISVNSLWSSNPDYSYPSIITNHRNNLRLKGNINLQYSGAVQISCGSVMTLSLIDTGKILGSGDVNYITRTDLSTQYPYSPNPPIGTFKNFFENQIKSFDIASDLSIFLLNTGKVLTVGLDAFGILGTGTISTDINIITSPVSVSTTGGYNGSNAVAVSSTVSNSLILLNTGKVVGFGSNFSGQLGDASTTTRYEPVAVSTTGTGNDYDGSNAIAIACGDGHSMILLNTGKVLSFGDNDYGQLGDGTIVGKYVPTPVSNTGGYDDTNAIAISTGEVHSMILLNTGKVLSFGDNNYGQLGDGTSGSTNNSSTPTPVSTDSSNGNDYNGSNAIAISCGKNHSMILLNTGKVLSFGDNQNAQLGNGTIGTTNNSDTPTPVSTDSSNGNDYNGSNAIAISTGLLHSMILLNSGKVLSFGRNNFGQLGNGTSGSTNNSSTPVAVSTIGTGNDYNGSNAIGISSRYNSSSILLNTGKVLSFGRNLFGQLGDGSTVDKDEPVAVNSANGYDGSNVKTIYNSFSFNIEGGRYNIEISDFTGYNRYNGKQVSCGNMHSLILLDNGNVFSFGSNRYGQLGIGNTTNSFLPVEVDSQTSDYNGFNAIGISAAAFNSFILLTTGKVVGFGSNYWGQLGDGSTTQRNSPVDVESANGYIKNNAIQISGGVFHSLILLNTGKVLSFGFNSSGQLGDGSTTQRTLPVSVVSANGYVEDNVIQISAGERHSLILLDTGNVLSFGSNQYGQLGNGTSGTINNSNNPVEVDSQNNGFYDGTNAIQVVANFDSSYILLNTGKVLSFGYNQFGELGDRTNTNKSTPTEIDSSNSDYNGSNAISISKSVSTIDNDEPDFYQVKVVKIILNTGQVVSFGGGIVDSDNTIDIRQLPQLDRVYRVTNHADLANVEEYNNGELGDARTYGSDDQFLNINMTSSNVENTPVNIKQSKPANSYSDPGDGLIIEKHSDSSHWIFSIDNDISADYNLNIVNNNGTGISFNSNNAINNPFTFTGQHLNFLNKNIDNNYYGLIVSSTGDYINLNNNLEPNIDESLPICKLTTIENDKKIFGVISDKEDKDRLYSSGIALSIMNKLNNNENRMYINSLGEGAIWVCNKNGNLENGDYISSCSIIGYGAKQIKNENLLSNHTVAKITCDCNFNLTKIIKQKLKLINNFNISINSIKDIDYDDNGDFQYEDDLDDSGNQQLEYQYDTRFLLADATQITKEEYDNKLQLGEEVYIACFVGCTYHCG